MKTVITNTPLLILKKREERRLIAGHVWVFSNEVDTERTPLKGFEIGQLAEIRSASGRCLGTGYVNPNSLICARLLHRDPLDKSDLRVWFASRLKSALTLRDKIYPQPYYRLVYGESDGLPGLVVDRFGDLLVAQISTAGMEKLRELVISTLRELLQPSGILLRNDSSVRELEGLERYIEVAFGQVPQRGIAWEGDVQCEFDFYTGQKTGWYYDQRDNRELMARYVRGCRVLDLFSYVGAWGIRACKGGATEVICVDSSAPALALASSNAERNGVHIECVKSDVFEFLDVLRKSDRKFDVVIVDPPALIKRRKDHQEGLQAYRRLNERAMQVLSPDGILISCTCSHHLEREQFLQLLRTAASRNGLNAQILSWREHSSDHPIHPSIPETSYLKACVLHTSTSH